MFRRLDRSCDCALVVGIEERRGVHGRRLRERGTCRVDVEGLGGFGCGCGCWRSREGGQSFCAFEGSGGAAGAA